MKIPKLRDLGAITPQSKNNFQVRKKRQNGGKYNPADTENRVGVGINKQMDIAAILDTPEPERLI